MLVFSTLTLLIMSLFNFQFSNAVSYHGLIVYIYKHIHRTIFCNRSYQSVNYHISIHGGKKAHPHNAIISESTTFFHWKNIRVFVPASVVFVCGANFYIKKFSLWMILSITIQICSVFLFTSFVLLSSVALLPPHANQ